MLNEILKYAIVVLTSTALILLTLVLTKPNVTPEANPPYQATETERTAEQPSTAAPTEAPTEKPTEAATAAPTTAPTEAPTNAPTAAPTNPPTEAPTEAVSLVSIQEVAFIGDSRTVLAGSITVGEKVGSGVIPNERIFAKYGGRLWEEEAKQNARAAGEAGTKKAVFWFGINDVQVSPNRDSETEFLANYIAVLDEFLKVNTDSEIYFLSVVTTSKEEKDYYDKQEENIAKYNRALKEYAAKMGYHYIDLEPIFLGESSFLPDHIHFTNEYYAGLMPFLEQHVGFYR